MVGKRYLYRTFFNWHECRSPCNNIWIKERLMTSIAHIRFIWGRKTLPIGGPYIAASKNSTHLTIRLAVYQSLPHLLIYLRSSISCDNIPTALLLYLLPTASFDEFILDRKLECTTFTLILPSFPTYCTSTPSDTKNSCMNSALSPPFREFMCSNAGTSSNSLYFPKLEPNEFSSFQM